MKVLRSQYYFLKPYLPRRLRMAVRRFVAKRKLARCRDIWPIKPGSESPPKGWQGWPQGKKFAVILTHDVEGGKGLERVRALAELEMEMGFRSSFNLIPEGSYRVTKEERDWLTGNGFEVGVHDLHHDGKLYWSRHAFEEHARKINHYLAEWGAVGFRSGFMLHNLEWMHQLDIQYDASTFDTDPFEPQPDGVETIFPFWVATPAAQAAGQKSEIREQGAQLPSRRRGYVELPYTLPQDSTLFNIFKHRTFETWKLKLDWVARHGGMVLLNVHPDYFFFPPEKAGSDESPVEHYSNFLRYLQSRYHGQYWHALPKEVASWAGGSLGPAETNLAAGVAAPALPAARTKPPRIWIDLDNTPHVPFFEPIIEELVSLGYVPLVTARDAFQVCDLARKKGMACLQIGHHSGKNRLMKVAGLFARALQLARVVCKEKPSLAISHGSRSQLLLCNWLGIPTILIEDYEFSQFPWVMRPTWVMAPNVVPTEAVRSRKGRLGNYPGIKEDVYAWKLKPDPTILAEFRIAESHLVVTVRPPATEAHYHNPESERLFEAFMEMACSTPKTRLVLLPRNKRQGELIRSRWPHWFRDSITHIPPGALDGLNLIWHSDLVVSGGGTMNREAAALGIPVYSIFRGSIGAVDRKLTEDGRLVLIETIDDVHRKIQMVKRPRKTLDEVTSLQTLREVVDAIHKTATALCTPSEKN